jgi:hypothetical protein
MDAIMVDGDPGDRDRKDEGDRDQPAIAEGLDGYRPKQIDEDLCKKRPVDAVEPDQILPFEPRQDDEGQGKRPIGG